MAQKRKAIAELQPKSKRLQKAVLVDDVGYSEHASDSESVSSYCMSENSDERTSQSKTPITPCSPAASAKYPSDLKTHLCPYQNCTKAFNRPARLAEHIRSHTNERIFLCEYDGCGKSFLRASHLTHHVKSAHTMVRDYVCDREGCGKTFVTGSRLRRHLAAHEGRDKYRCTEYPPCHETFRKHSTLQKHVKMVHLKQKPFPCPHIDPATEKQCQQGFDTAGHLRSHTARIHGGARFTCTECMNTRGEASSSENSSPEVTFPTYALLQAHMRTAHPPMCPVCNRAFSTSRELRRHLDITHGNVSLENKFTYRCDYPGCGRSFSKKGNLNVHVRTVHEGEKRFVCGQTDLSTSRKIEGWTGHDACGKRYGSKLSLEEHIRTAHLGLKNSKATRREELGLNSQTRAKVATPSNLAMLTGDGYVEESNRSIPCLIEQCPHFFRRDYDLWLHMSAKHDLEENDIQLLFMKRAMHGGDEKFTLDFETPQIGSPILGLSGSGQTFPEEVAIGDSLIQDAIPPEEQFFFLEPGREDQGSAADYMDDLEAVDPLLTFMTAEL